MTEMLPNYKLQIVIVATAWCLAVSGCGEAGPTKYPVTGVVSYNGRPLPRGNVMFVQEKGPAAVGTIASDGSYHLEAAAGKHRVGVTAIPEPPPGADEMNYVSPPPLVPAEYGQPDTSGLVVEVQPNKNTTIDINIPYDPSQ